MAIFDLCFHGTDNSSCLIKNLQNVQQSSLSQQVISHCAFNQIRLVGMLMAKNVVSTEHGSVFESPEFIQQRILIKEWNSVIAKYFHFVSIIQNQRFSKLEVELPFGSVFIESFACCLCGLHAELNFESISITPVTVLCPRIFSWNVRTETLSTILPKENFRKFSASWFFGQTIWCQTHLIIKWSFQVQYFSAVLREC